MSSFLLIIHDDDKDDRSRTDNVITFTTTASLLEAMNAHTCVPRTMKVLMHTQSAMHDDTLTNVISSVYCRGILNKSNKGFSLLLPCRISILTQEGFIAGRGLVEETDEPPHCHEEYISMRFISIQFQEATDRFIKAIRQRDTKTQLEWGWLFWSKVRRELTASPEHNVILSDFFMSNLLHYTSQGREFIRRMIQSLTRADSMVLDTIRQSSDMRTSGLWKVQIDESMKRKSEYQEYILSCRTKDDEDILERLRNFDMRTLIHNDESSASNGTTTGTQQESDVLSTPSSC